MVKKDHKNITITLSQNLTLNWCWSMVKKDHKNITITLSQNLTLNWCWCMVKNDHRNITISLSQNLTLNWCWSMVKNDHKNWTNVGVWSRLANAFYSKRKFFFSLSLFLSLSMIWGPNFYSFLAFFMVKVLLEH